MTIFVRMLAELVREEKRVKKEKEFEVPEGMILIPRQVLEDYLAECDHPVPDASLRLTYRGRLRYYLEN